MRDVRLSERIRYRLWSLPRSPRELDAALLGAGTYRRMGWFTTLHSSGPVDGSGAELPCFTYPATYWLAGALRGSERVFEYGAGNSTLWFSRHVAEIASVESDKRCANRLESRLPANASVQYRACTGDELWAGSDDEYVAALTGTTGSYDVVVVGGLARNSCVSAVIKSAGRDGLVVLNNADRPAYRPAADRLKAAGYQRLDFIGPAPGIVNFSCTSMFCIDFSPWLTDAPVPPYFGVEVGHLR